jgi:hypothetical protein
MLKLTILTTRHSSHAVTKVLTTTHFSHAETDNFDHGTFQQFWNGRFQLQHFSAMLKLSILTMTHSSHAVTNLFDANTQTHFSHAKTDYFDHNTFPAMLKLTILSTTHSSHSLRWGSDPATFIFTRDFWLISPSCLYWRLVYRRAWQTTRLLLSLNAYFAIVRHIERCGRWRVNSDNWLCIDVTFVISF